MTGNMPNTRIASATSSTASSSVSNTATSLSISAVARRSYGATNYCRAKCSATAIVSAPISTTYGASRAARRFSCRARIRSSLSKLFAQEVPEIYDGIVEVKAVARDPGSRAKIAVISRDSSVDPVGACVGMRGSRVQAVVNELQGEKIDIIPWSPDIATFVVNALAPAEVAKVVLDEDKERIEVVVPDQQLSLAIGRRGQNVRLASQLTGWDIDILTEQEESERRQAEFENRTKIFVEALNLDEVVGQLLASEGFGSIEELAMVDEKEIASIEGFDADTARELQERAKEYLDKQEAELDAKRVSWALRTNSRMCPASRPKCWLRSARTA